MKFNPCTLLVLDHAEGTAATPLLEGRDPSIVTLLGKVCSRIGIKVTG